MSAVAQRLAQTFLDSVMAIATDTAPRYADQRRALSAFAIRVAGAGIAYLSQALLARWLGAFDYGVFAYVWIWILLLSVVASLGMSASAMKFVPWYRERGADEHLRGFLFGSAAITLLVATALALAGAGAVYLTAVMMDDHFVMPLFLAAICLPMFALTDLQDGIGRAFSWIDAALLPPYILRPLLLLILMAVAIGWGAPPTAVTAMLCAIGAIWMSALAQSMILWLRIRRTLVRGQRRYNTWNWVAVSAPFMFMEGFYLLMSYTDILVIEQFSGPRDIAIYFAAAKTAGLVAFVHFAVLAVAMPRFAQHHASGDSDRLAAAVHEAARWMFWPTLAASAAILAFGWPLLWLFGPEFTHAYPLMFILIAGLMTRAAMGPADAVLNMSGHQIRTMWVLSATSALNIILNFVLIPWIGLYGAATATALALGIQAVVLFAMAKRTLGINACVFGGAPKHASV